MQTLNLSLKPAYAIVTDKIETFGSGLAGLERLTMIFVF
jgi:hypothetical protein